MNNIFQASDGYDNITINRDVRSVNGPVRPQRNWIDLHNIIAIPMFTKIHFNKINEKRQGSNRYGRSKKSSIA